eukprot:SAG31_NODE_530_length_14420_cov_4.259968_3_plen_286_part_00
MLSCDISNLAGAHEAVPGYSHWNQSYIIDGSGVYITRNQAYQGTFRLVSNIAFDNGINGLVVHQTNNANVAVVVERNIIFNNGRTSAALEGRQAAGGLVINHGNNVVVRDNIVKTTSARDYSYRCFGTCNVVPSTSTNNSHCNGVVSPGFPASAFRTKSLCGINEAAIRARYPRSGAGSTSARQTSPEYIFFPGTHSRCHAVPQTCQNNGAVRRSTDAVNRVCCDDPSEDCTDGTPHVCNRGCAEVFLPFFALCGGLFGSTFDAMVSQCQVALGVAPPSTPGGHR